MSSSAGPYKVLSWLKILLLIFTVIFLITGVIFLATGIYAWMALKHYIDLSPDISIQMTPAVLCGIGGYVIISGLFGFLTAFKNNKCMTNCYCFLLAIVLISELAGGIAAIVFVNQIKDSFIKGFTSAITSYNPTVPNAIDKAQLDLNCCGVFGYQDWFETNLHLETFQCSSQKNSTTVPYSCCKPSFSVDKKGSQNLASHVCYCGSPSDLQYINTQGCIPVIFGSKGQTLHYLIAIAFGSAAVQITGIIISLCIYRKLQQISLSRRHL